jgi:hypothetical protein
MQVETNNQVECKLITSTDILTGSIYYPPRFRFSDIIGLPDSQFMMLFDCTSEPVEWGWDRKTTATPRRVVVNREQLLFIFPMVEPERTKRPLDEEVEYQEKQAYRVDFTALGWSISGNIHVVEGVLPSEVLSRGVREFFPLTSVVASYGGVRPMQFQSDIMVLNRKHVSLFWLNT